MRRAMRLAIASELDERGRRSAHGIRSVELRSLRMTAASRARHPNSAAALSQRIFRFASSEIGSEAKSSTLRRIEAIPGLG